MINKILALFLLATTTAFAADNIIGDKTSGSLQLIDNTGSRWNLGVAYTTNGSGDIYTLGGDVASNDDVIGDRTSGSHMLIDNNSTRWNLMVWYTTDGNGNVVPISGGGGSSGVTTFNGRSGAVISTIGDYSFSQVSGSLSSSQVSAGGGVIASNNLSDLSSASTARSNLGLVASATTDTTDASNITSGTLPDAVSGALTGDVTKPAGSSVTTIIGVNGATVPPNGGSITTNNSGQITSVKSIAAAYGFGDSFVFGVATDSRLGGVNQILRDVPGPVYNFAKNAVALSSGAQSLNQNTFFYLKPDPNKPNVSIVSAGSFEAPLCTTMACINTFLNYLNAAVAWMTIPAQNRILASSAAKTGTWATFTSIVTQAVINTSNGLASIGTPESSVTSGSTLTFSVPSGANSIGVTYYANSSNAGTFSMSVDGTLMVDNCSGTTTFSVLAACAGGSTLTYNSSSWMRQDFTGLGSGAHTVIITLLSAATTPILSIDYVPTIQLANSGAVFLLNVPSAYTNASTWNTSISGLGSRFLSEGLNVFNVDVFSNTNSTTDTSTTSTSTCTAATTSKFFNSCGQTKLYNLINSVEATNDYIFSAPQIAGQPAPNTATFNAPLTVHSNSNPGVHAAITDDFNPENYITGRYLSLSGIDYGIFQTYEFGIGFHTDATSGFPSSGLNVDLNYGPTAGGHCFSLYTSSLTSTPSSFACKAYIAYGTGAINSPQFVPTGSVDTIAVGTAAGTGATATITGTAVSGTFTLTTGTVTAASGTLVTITAAAGLPSAPKSCHLQPMTVNAQISNSLIYTTSPSTSSWTVAVGTVALPLSTGTMTWGFLCE